MMMREREIDKERLVEEVEGTRHHFTKAGRLVANKQIVYTIHADRGLLPVRINHPDVSSFVTHTVHSTGYRLITR
jgi:hypothetical protein